MNFNFKGNEIYINDLLAEKLDLMCERCTQRKFDNLLLIDGDEGYGKSTLGVSICAYISHVTGRPFSIDNVFFDVDKLLEFSANTKDQIVFWDEGALGGLASESYNKLQIKLLKLLMVARKKRHFYIFLIPKFYRLKESIVDRAIGLLHVYARNERELGRFCYYTKKNKEFLYEYWRRKKQKAYKNYYSFHGSFGDVLAQVIDEHAYDSMKDMAIVGILGNDERQSNSLVKLKAQLNALRQVYASLPNITQKELGKYASVSERTIRLWKTGANVSVGSGIQGQIDKLGDDKGNG